tara:strand:- start:29 stop:355 length:327 start_codon:yes stop_codon:yes gene_type:complete
MITAIDFMEEAIELKRKKSADYQGGILTEEQYFPFGYESYMHMVLTKVNRIRSVMERDNKSDVNFESAEDSVIDLVNYAAMMGAWMRNNPQASTPTDTPITKKKKAKK